MTAVWEIAPYNTDEDTWRERMEAKSAEQHRLWALQKAAEDARYQKPKPTPVENPPETRTCRCGATFKATTSNRRYCSLRCRRRAARGSTGPIREHRRNAPALESCAGGCGRTLRARHLTDSDAPGTVRVYANRMCRPCWRASNSTERSCKKCGTTIPRDARASQVYCSKACKRGEPKVVRIFGVSPCPGCGRLTRPKKSTMNQYPGTVQRHAHGMCSPCARATRQEVAA